MKTFFNLKYSNFSRLIELSLLAVSVMVACEKPTDHALSSSQYENLMKFTNEEGIPSVHQKMLLVIPTQGCGPCIDKALKFVEGKSTFDDLTVVVSTRSTKQFNNLMRKYGVDKTLITFDNKALSFQYDLITIYPTLFRVSGEYTLGVHLDATNIEEELKKARLTL